MIACVHDECVGLCATVCECDVRGQHCGVQSPFPHLCGCWRLDSGGQVSLIKWQLPFTSEASQWPMSFYLSSQAVWENSSSMWVEAFSQQSILDCVKWRRQAEPSFNIFWTADVVYYG